MSYCRNCGEKIGDGKFCTKCGASVGDNTTYVVVSNVHSPHYQQIYGYYRQATGLLVLGILCMIPFLGLIFEIIYAIVSALMKEFEIKVNLANYPEEQKMMKQARGRHKAGVIMYCIGLILFPVLLGLFGV